MGQINDIFRKYYPAYFAKFGDKVPQNHQKIASYLTNCRTGAYGVSQFECDDCNEVHTVSNGCGSRNCPNCQQHKNYEWAEKQKDKLLPVNYFMVTFTVPQEVRKFIRSNQKFAYNALFKAGSQTLKTLLKNKRFVGADIAGFFGVLHTWGRDLNYHPHVHFIVPGGGLTKDSSEWKGAGKNFLIPVKAASKIFREKFIHEVAKIKLEKEIDSRARFKSWNVNIQAVGDGEKALDYLAPYVFKTAIADSRIVSYDESKVVIKVKRSGSKKIEHVTFSTMEFIRRFLQHVLPSGFMKVRHYGFLSSNPSITIEALRLLIDGNEVADINTHRVWATLQSFVKKEPKKPPRKLKCSCGSTNLKFIFHTWQPINSD